MFEVSWEDFKGEWIRAYSKEVVVVTDHSAETKTMKVGRKKKKKRRILRIERQEYPDDRLRAAVEAKLPSSLAASTAMANSSTTSVDAA
jgi:hypothetical protein